MAVNLQELLRRHQALRSARTEYEPRWRELASHFYPNGCRTDSEQHSTGKPSNQTGQLNSVGRYGMRDFAAGMHGGMTSPSRPWFMLEMQDSSINMREDVKVWLDSSTRIINKVLHTSNFYSEVHIFYWQIGSFGTAFMFRDMLPNGRLRFKTLAAGEYCVDVNAMGVVDTLFRTINMTLRQLVLEFGLSKLPDALKRMYEKPANWQERYVVTHAVYPRKDGEVGGRSENKPFASIYYLESGTKKTGSSGNLKRTNVLRESGYDQFPGFCARWSITGGDIYGTGPGEETLPDSKLVQQMTVSMLKAIHKELDPAMVVPAGYERLSLVPGTVNPIDDLNSGGGPKIYPAAQVRHNIADTFATITQKEEGIRKGLYNDLFRMMIDTTRRQITATEVSAKEGEKLMLLGPILERLQTEFFIPLIEDVFAVLYNEGQLPPPPEDLGGSQMEIVFISMLAQAQKAAASGSIERLAQFIFSLGQAKPEAMDALNTDSTIDEYADSIGAPVNLLNSPEQRQAIREQRAQAQAAQAEQDNMVNILESAAKVGLDPQAVMNTINNEVPNSSAAA